MGRSSFLCDRESELQDLVTAKNAVASMELQRSFGMWGALPRILGMLIGLAGVAIVLRH